MFYLNNPPLINGGESAKPLEFFEYYQEIGLVKSGQTQTLLLPEANVKCLHIGKDYAPQDYSDKNVIFMECLNEEGLVIVQGVSVSFAMNQCSEYLFLPPGTVSIVFVRSIAATAESINLYTHYYGV